MGKPGGIMYDRSIWSSFVKGCMCLGGLCQGINTDLSEVPQPAANSLAMTCRALNFADNSQIPN